MGRGKLLQDTKNNAEPEREDVPRARNADMPLLLWQHRPIGPASSSFGDAWGGLVALLCLPCGAESLQLLEYPETLRHLPETLPGPPRHIS